MVKTLKIFFFVNSLLLAGCFRNEAPVQVKELKGEVFGSYYILKYAGDLDQEKFARELSGFFTEFNSEFSTYQDNSTISQFNLLPAHKTLSVSPRFIQMLKLAARFHKETNGAFDPTLGPVIKAWGFGGGKAKKRPSEEELADARSKVGFQHVKWDEEKNAVWKTISGLQMDVNAFAPGWASDLIGDLLSKKGVRNFMIDISGDILFKGQKSEGSPWVAGIEKPSEKRAEGVYTAFKIQDSAVSTSGNYRQFFNEAGTRKSHIIDPRTGHPVAHNVTSATVIGENGAAADAWSTAMMVLGPEGVALSEKNDIKVLLLVAERPGAFTEIVSSSMKRFIEAHQL